MGKTLATSVSCGFNAHQSRILAILHIADQNAVFDKCVFARWGAFIINIDRSAPLGECAIVQNSDLGCGNFLSHQSGKCAGSFSVKVTLQPVSNGFVQKNPGPAWAKNNIHGPSRRGYGLKIYNCYSQSLTHFGLPGINRNKASQIETTSTAAVT